MTSNRKLVYAYHSMLWPFIAFALLLGFLLLSKISDPKMQENIGQDYLLQQQQSLERQIQKIEEKIEASE